MKVKIKKAFIALAWLLPLMVSAQTFTVLHNFGADGSGARSELTLKGDTLYGTTTESGSFGYGTIFKMNTNGTGYTVLHDFTNSPDGGSPIAGLTLSGDTLYGTTLSGGGSGNGVIFRVNTDGSGYAVLYNFNPVVYAGYSGLFTNSDGITPYAGLVLSDNILYGTTYGGGSSGYGTVFKINTNGSGYTVLKVFVNSPDGANPVAALALSDSTLYGTTSHGGSAGYGTIFKMNTDGSDYTVLHNFTNSPDGAYSYTRLMLWGGALYGVTYGGGSSGNGTVFKVNTNGTGYAVLYSFTGSPDGSRPYGILTLFGSTLYGMTSLGGSASGGTVYQINTNGSGYAVLKSFTGTEGIVPYAGLTLSESAFYGTTSGYGTLFAMTLPGPPRVSGGIVQTGLFNFTITGYVNQTIIVEASTNLVNWQPVWTNTLSSTCTIFTDTQWANLPSRFYRAR